MHVSTTRYHSLPALPHFPFPPTKLSAIQVPQPSGLNVPFPITLLVSGLFRGLIRFNRIGAACVRFRPIRLGRRFRLFRLLNL